MQQFCLPIFSRQILYEIEIHVTNFICIQYFFVINKLPSSSALYELAIRKRKYLNTLF